MQKTAHFNLVRLSMACNCNSWQIVCFAMSVVNANFVQHSVRVSTGRRL